MASAVDLRVAALAIRPPELHKDEPITPLLRRYITFYMMHVLENTNGWEKLPGRAQYQGKIEAIPRRIHHYDFDSLAINLPTGGWYPHAVEFIDERATSQVVGIDPQA